MRWGLCHWRFDHLPGLRRNPPSRKAAEGRLLPVKEESFVADACYCTEPFLSCSFQGGHGGPPLPTVCAGGFCLRRISASFLLRQGYEELGKPPLR